MSTSPLGTRRFGRKNQTRKKERKKGTFEDLKKGEGSTRPEPMGRRIIYIHIYVLGAKTAVTFKLIQLILPWAVLLPGLCFWLFPSTFFVLVVICELSNLCFAVKAKGKLKNIPLETNGRFGSGQ